MYKQTIVKHFLKHSNLTAIKSIFVTGDNKLRLVAMILLSIAIRAPSPLDSLLSDLKTLNFGGKSSELDTPLKSLLAKLLEHQ